MESTIKKFPHKVDYIISCVYDETISKLIIYTGNNEGEVYIYEASIKGEVTLVDMIITNKQSVVRNALKISEDSIVVSNE